jgi:excisionase family DNA binding protein
MSQPLLPTSIAVPTENPALSSPMLPLLLSIVRAAECLGISRAHFYEILDQYDLPTVRLGRRRMVRTKDLENFVASLDATRDYFSPSQRESSSTTE